MFKNTKSAPQAIIFDWDGTLANTRPLVVSALEKTLALYGLPNWDTIKAEKRDTNKSLKENFPNFFGCEAVEAYNKYLAIYLNDFSFLKTYEGVEPTLSFLTSMNIPLIIISNKEKSLLIKEVDYLFKDIHFYKILGNGDAEQNKPHPSPVQEALKDTGIDPLTALVWLIGDTKQDTECAYASGCLPFLIGKGGFMDDTYIEEKKKSSTPLNTFPDFKSLLEWLKGNSN